MRTPFAVLILLLCPALLRAQCTGSSPTWTSTPDQTSVARCFSNALAGDTINVSAGTATWTSGISTSKVSEPTTVGVNVNRAPHPDEQIQRGK